jgi:glycogen phosphorylase
LAAKAHSHDGGGKQLIQRLHELLRALRGKITIAYIPDYDLSHALAMVSRSDIWLNTPLPPPTAIG